MELSDWLVDRLLVDCLWGLFIYGLSVEGICRLSVSYLLVVCELSVGVRPAPAYVCHKFAVSVFLIASKTHLNAF